MFLQETPKELSAVVKIQRVVGVLRYLGKPAIVREDEINNLKILTENSESAQKIPPRSLVNYAPVALVAGPFKGLKGIYKAVDGKQKVIVQVEVLNSFTEVTLPFEHIKEILKGKAFELDDATESIKIAR